MLPRGGPETTGIEFLQKMKMEMVIDYKDAEAVIGMICETGADWQGWGMERSSSSQYRRL